MRCQVDQKTISGNWNFRTSQRRRFSDQVGGALGYKYVEDWYQINGGGEPFRDYFSASKSEQEVCIGHHRKFKSKEDWRKAENCKVFLDWLGNCLGYKQLEDWYKVTTDTILQHGGELLLQSYNGFIIKALENAYPQHNWVLWNFNSVPTGYWGNSNNHRDFFDWSGVKLGYKCMDDWYNLSKEDIQKHGGTGFLNSNYNNSPYKALQCVYPEHNWMLWRFHIVPSGYLDRLAGDTAEQKKLINWLGDKLAVKSLNDWYRISMNQIQKLVLIKSSDILADMLQSVYPLHKWDKDKIGKRAKSSQRELTMAMQQLFPVHSTECDKIPLSLIEIFEEYKHTELPHSASGLAMELDVYAPELQLALEYQGEQHYKAIYWVYDFEAQKQKDEQKRQACKKVNSNTVVKNVLLLYYPYYFN